MTKSGSTNTEGRWTATMAAEDYKNDPHAREVARQLRKQGEFPAQLADAIESGRAMVEGSQIMDPTDGRVLADWDQFGKRARKPMSTQERMEELHARARASVLEQEARFAAFVAKEYPAVNLADLGVCGDVRAVIERLWRCEPAFRVKPEPRDAWEMVRGYFDAIDVEELSDSVFDDSWEAFDAGFTFGVALARHDPDHLGSRTPRVAQDSEAGDRHE